MAKRPAPKRREAPAYDENGDLTAVAVSDNDAAALLQGRGLQVKRVMRSPTGSLTVEWRKPPTEAERAFVDELLPGAAHAP
jgi:hypothetical protein